MAYFLAIDVEASGQGIKTNFMTQLGAALINIESGEIEEVYRSYLAQPERTNWEERCLNEFWLKHPKLYEETLLGVDAARPAQEVMAEFKDWVLDVTEDKQVTIIFDTAGFDQAWVDYNLGDTSCLYLLGYYKPTRDLSSFCIGLGGYLHEGRSSDDIFYDYGGEKLADITTHKADEDASVIARNAVLVTKTCKKMAEV